jgi:hypothetical protein
MATVMFWVVCALASSLWCVSAAARWSATFDEPLYVAAGLDAWRSGSHAPLLRWGTMPLPADVQMLPLYLAERWRGEPFDPVTDLERLLPWARAMNLVFWWLLLGYGCLIGQALAGAWGARLATVFLATEPNLLAHASLATTDIAVTAVLLALVYHFRRGRGAGWPRRVGLPLLLGAVAVLAKASALVIGPLCLVAIEGERLWRAGRIDANSVRAAARDLTYMAGGGLVLVFVACGSDWRPNASFVAWAQTLPDGIRGPMTAVAEHLRIFSNAGEALWRQISHNLRGHGAFLLGHTHARALWYYFPVLLTIKLSAVLLCAPLVVAILRPRALGNWALVSAAVLLAYSITFRVQLGVRMVLPLVALFVIGIAAALVHTAGAGTRRTRAVVATLATWSTVVAITAWPHGLAHANRLWGDPADAYRLVSDSNFDWGQGLKDLLRWQQESNSGEVALWYFGTDPLAQRAPLRLLPLHTMSVADGRDVIAAARGDRLAVSVTLLYGTTLNDAHRTAAAFLRGRQPIARTMTFLIFDLGDAAYRTENVAPAPAG